jgi:hypothetical protein
VSGFKICRIEIFWKINVDHVVGTHMGKMNCKKLKKDDIKA